MAKKINVKPQGRFMFHTWGADTGGCGIIRTWIPSMLMTSFRYKAANFLSTYNYSYVSDSHFYDNMFFVKFQRPAEEAHVKMIKDLKFRIRQAPVVIDYDDYVFDIPEINIASSYYTERVKYIEEALSIADGITVSTDFLRNKLLKYNSNISIVPNYLPKFLWKEPEFDLERPMNEKPKILYPGSSTHFNQNGSGGDFESELIDYIKSTTDKYEWHFIGGYPYDLKENKDVFIHHWQSYFEYPDFIKSLNVDLAIAPLEVNDFNKSKSNIKFQEYVASGICGIFQDIEPYKNAQLKAKSAKEFIDLIEFYAYRPKKQYDVWLKDYETLKNDLFFEGNELKWFNRHLKLFNREIK